MILTCLLDKNGTPVTPLTVIHPICHNDSEVAQLWQRDCVMHVGDFNGVDLGVTYALHL